MESCVFIRRLRPLHSLRRCVSLSVHTATHGRGHGALTARRLSWLCGCTQMTHLLSVLRAQANMQTNVMAKIQMLNVRPARVLRCLAYSA